MGMGILGGEGQRVENWDNCNSIIDRIYFLKKENRIEHLKISSVIEKIF